jgi:hypothetical protein
MEARHLDAFRVAGKLGVGEEDEGCLAMTVRTDLSQLEFRTERIAQVAVESFEARARIINAWLDLPFPTLSILHLIDQLRDALANATTLAEKKAVKEPTYAFHLLAANGVTTKEAYDKAAEVFIWQVWMNI